MTKEAHSPMIVVRCDANETIGGGHVMRCLTLANNLAAQGAKIIFVSAALPEALANRIISAGHQIKFVSATPELQRSGVGWEEPPISAAAQMTDAEMTVAAAGRANWIIVDHYLLDAHWHSAVRHNADQILVIDDLANRRYDCDILLDQTFGRSKDRYRSRTADGTNILAGATYALLRPEFSHLRPVALQQRRDEEPVSKILISMGTADSESITAQILDNLQPFLSDFAIDVVLSPQAPSLSQVQKLAARNSSISVHLDSEKMAELMTDADISIGAAGTTSWERCCLGLPTILLVLAENQRLIATNLEREGAVTLAESAEAVSRHLRRLVEDGRKRQSMTAVAAAIVDGLGCDRVCSHMLEKQIFDANQLHLRKAEVSDKETLWLWRNDPVMRAMAKTQDPVIWSEHAKWFSGVMESERTTLYIAVLQDDTGAMVRFDRQDGEALVSINVAPHMRGKGFGTSALIRACEAYESDHPNIILSAEIRESNMASKSAFRAAGFEEIDQGGSEISKFVRSDKQGKDAVISL